MKAHHFGILFTLISLTVYLSIDIHTRQMQVIMDESNQMDQVLSMAVDDAANAMIQSNVNGELILSKEEGANTFLTSMYSSMDIISDVAAQQKLRLYLPVIMVIEEDGFYVLHNDEYEVEGKKSVVMRWSEKYPYVYEDSDFIYRFSLSDKIIIYDKNGVLSIPSDYLAMDYHEFRTLTCFDSYRKRYPKHFILEDEMYHLVRKEAIIHTINEKMSLYLNQHNQIASQYGIHYQFSLPVIDESLLVRSIEHPGMLVIFQGYPFQGTSKTYNRVEMSGAQIYEKERYYIEDKGWYKLYHSISCEDCKNNPYVDTTIVYTSNLDCAKQGAYGCKKCTKGVQLPDNFLKNSKNFLNFY